MKLALILCFSTFTLLGQQIKGTVLEVKTNNPLNHVNVYIKKKGIGTTTNKRGDFDLKLKSKINETDIIQFSIIGYKSKKHTFSELKAMNYTVHLLKKPENLNEVFVHSSIKLNSKISFKKLSSLKKGIHSFDARLINQSIYVIGGDASHIEDTAKKTLLEVGAMPEATLFDFIKKLKTNPTWENYLDNLQIYNFNTDTWTTSKLKFRKRAYHNVVHYKDELYVLGGKRLSTNRKKEYLDDKIEVYNLNDNSILIDDTNPHQAVNATSVVYDNKIIIMGGSTKLNKNGTKVYTNKIHLYDLESGLWFELNNMTSAKEAKGILIKGNIYLIGGSNGKALKKIESFNLSTGKWNNEGELFDGIESPALTRHKNTIYIFNNNKILTYNINNKVLNQYRIDLNLNASALYYNQNKLYILGGYRENEYSKTPSAGLYSIDLDEFSKTTITKSKRLTH